MVPITVCDRCRARYFPAKLRCRRCGGTLFSQQTILEARVVEFTEVLRPVSPHAWTWLLEVEAPLGLKLIAVASFAPARGQVVNLQQHADGAIVAQAAQQCEGSQ